MIRCRIARVVNGRAQYLAFIGPSIDAIPRGWSFVTRRLARPNRSK